MTDDLRFQAEIIKVATKQDHAFRLTLDLPESEYKAATALMEAYQRGAVLHIAAVAIEAAPIVQSEPDDRREPKHYSPYTSPPKA